MFVSFQVDAQEEEVVTEKEQKSGFEIKIEGGYYGGLLINENFLVYNSGFGASVLPGYRINDYFSIYGGVGIERLEDGVLIPIFASFESYFSPKLAGYIEVRVGYSGGFNNRSINIDYDYNGGFVFGFGVGRDLYKNDKLRLALSFSYNFRQASYNYRPFPNSESIQSKFDYNLFAGKIAFSFR